MEISYRSILSKSVIFLFLLYLFWYKEAIGNSPLFLYGGTFIVLLSTLVYIDRKPISTFRIPKGIIYWILYAIYSVITGIAVATNYGELFSSIITFLAFIVVCICIGVVCMGEESFDWVLKCIIIISVISAFYTIFNGYPYYNGVIVTTMGPENNPNTLGVLMVIGIFCSVYIQKNNIPNFFMTLFLNVLFIYVIILTASKKALLSAGVLIAIWSIVYIKNLFKRKNILAAIFGFLTFTAILAVILTQLEKVFFNSASFERMQTLLTSGSSTVRVDMYNEAWNMFLKGPLFGVGYNQFKYHSVYGSYAHSTYAEVISGAGLIGGIIYFFPIVICSKKLIEGFVKTKQYRQGILVGLLIVELFLGTVQIFMYEFIHILVWTLLFIILENDFSYNCTEDDEVI